jgi:hypothetical protein
MALFVLNVDHPIAGGCLAIDGSLVPTAHDARKFTQAGDAMAAGVEAARRYRLCDIRVIRIHPDAVHYEPGLAVEAEDYGPVSC